MSSDLYRSEHSMDPLKSKATNAGRLAASRGGPRVSIIIPFRNEERTIEQSVMSVVKQDYPSLVEILVINDGSTDGSVKIVKRLIQMHDCVRLIESNGSGEAEARNTGISSSSGQVIVQFSAHAVATANFLNVLVSKLEMSSPIVAGVGCKHIAGHGQGWSLAFGEAMRTVFGGYGTTYYQHGTERFVESVAYAAYRTGVFAHLGLFDLTIVRGVDAEFNLRLAKAGYKLLYTEATAVYHYEVASPRVFFAKLMGAGAARMKIIRKYPWSFRHVYALPSVAIFVLGFLAAASIFDGRVTFALLGLTLVYAACSFVAAVKTALGAGLKQTLRLMLAFPMLHAGYGIGFIKELIWPS